MTIHTSLLLIVQLASASLPLDLAPSLWSYEPASIEVPWRE
jgi:hypothetical protein